MPHIILLHKALLQCTIVVVIDHIAPCKSFVVIISIATKKHISWRYDVRNKLNIWLVNNNYIIKNINVFHFKVE
jgi:hypothetical protein